MKVPLIRPSVGKLGMRLRSLNEQAQAAYRSPEHARWAKAVIERAGFRCEKCGRARAQGVRLSADHIKEIKDGGTWTMANGQCLCGKCHTVKTIIERAKRYSLPPVAKR